VIDYLRGPDPAHSRIYMSMALKAVMALSFPLILYAAGFYEERERKRIIELANRLGSTLRGFALPTAPAAVVVAAKVDELEDGD
jgi:hypothetical protein